MRILRVYPVVLFVLALTLLGLPAPTPAAEPAYFQVGFAASDAIFTIKLTDPQQIEQARMLIANDSAKLVMGTIVKEPVWYNQPWSYHLAPQSISFADLAVEVCAASPGYVEENLAEVGGAFLPANVWCPWDSSLGAEVTPAVILLPLVVR